MNENGPDEGDMLLVFWWTIIVCALSALLIFVVAHITFVQVFYSFVGVFTPLVLIIMTLNWFLSKRSGMTAAYGVPYPWAAERYFESVIEQLESEDEENGKSETNGNTESD